MPSQFSPVLADVLVQDHYSDKEAQWCNWNPMGGFVVTGSRDIKEACGLKYLIPFVNWPTAADFDHGVVRVLKKCARRQIAGTRSMPAKDLLVFIRHAYEHQAHEPKVFVCNLRDVESLTRMLVEAGWKDPFKPNHEDCKVLGCKSAPKRTIFALPFPEFLGISPGNGNPAKHNQKGIGIFNPNTVVAVRRVGAWPWDKDLSEDDEDGDESEDAED